MALRRRVDCFLRETAESVPAGYLPTVATWRSAHAVNAGPATVAVILPVKPDALGDPFKRRLVSGVDAGNGVSEFVSEDVEDAPAVAKLRRNENLVMLVARTLGVPALTNGAAFAVGALGEADRHADGGRDLETLFSEPGAKRGDASL
jgi:hypothetical protein